MNPALMIETALTATVIGGVITMMVRSNASLERGRISHNQRAAQLAARPVTYPRAVVRSADGDGVRRTRPAMVGTPAKQALPAGAAFWRPDPAPDAGLPPRGAPIRLDDGRTGTVAAIERVGRASRVHLELDNGGRGHVDVPDNPPPPSAPLRPQVQRQIQPQVQVRAEVKPRQEPAPQSAPRPRKVFVVPATAVPASATPSASTAGTVRLGGFTMPASPVAGTPAAGTAGAAAAAGGRS